MPRIIYIENAHKGLTPTQHNNQFYIPWDDNEDLKTLYNRIINFDYILRRNLIEQIVVTSHSSYTNVPIMRQFVWTAARDPNTLRQFYNVIFMHFMDVIFWLDGHTYDVFANQFGEGNEPSPLILKFFSPVTSNLFMGNIILKSEWRSGRRLSFRFPYRK